MKRAKKSKRVFPAQFILVEPIPWISLGGRIESVGNVPLIRGKIGMLDTGIRFVVSPKP